MGPARIAITTVGLIAAFGGVVLMLARDNNDYFFLCAAGFGLVLLGTVTGGRRAPAREPAPEAGLDEFLARQQAAPRTPSARPSAPPVPAPPAAPPAPPPPLAPARPAPPASATTGAAKPATAASPLRPERKPPAPVATTKPAPQPEPKAPRPQRAGPSAPVPAAAPSAERAGNGTPAASTVQLEPDRTPLPEPQPPNAGELLRGRAAQLPGAPAAIAGVAAGALGAVVLARRLLRR